MRARDPNLAAKTSRRSVFLRAAAIAAALLSGACASYMPVNELAQAKGALQAAEQVGATQYPSSAVELQIAREELGRATRLMNAGEGDAASLGLQRARADADLAMTLAREESARAQAAAAMRRADELRSGIR